MEQSVTQTSTPTIEEENTTTASPSTKPTAARNPALLLAIIALFLAVITAADLNFLNRRVKENVVAANNQIIAVRNQLTTQINTNVVNSLRNLQQQQQQQQQALQQLQQMAAGNQNYWLLAEINYLVQLAEYTLHFTQDIPSAIKLLQAADERATQVNSLDLRQLLAKNILTLQNIPPLDLAGITSRLNSLQQQIMQLPLRLPHTPAQVPGSNTSNSNNLSPWQQALHSSWHTLQTLIVVRRTDQTIEPLLPEIQLAYLQQNLQLLLLQAQIAALRGQATSYQNSLQQAKNQITRYFAINALVTQSTLQTLLALQKINVQPTLPDLSGLIQILDQKRQAIYLHKNRD